MKLPLLHLSLFGAITAALVAGVPTARAQQAAWEQWQHVVGVVDVASRSDGSLLAMANGRLYVISPNSPPVPFAAGPDGFSGDPTAEPYFVAAPGLAVTAAGCAWTADELFVLDLGSPLGIVRVDASGRATHFATLTGVDTLGGIAFDTTGGFDHRLLVTGAHDGNQTTVFSIDCLGSSVTVTTSAPQLEGGLAVAPASFGVAAGALIAPDENTGRVYAIDSTGAVNLIANSGLPSGGDTGVESAGFVPPGFASASAGYAYLADRGTPDNPFPGTDSLLRLSSTALADAGVQDGDLLVSTEGNGTTIAVRCQDTCSVTQVAAGPNGGHIEGHIVAVVSR